MTNTFFADGRDAFSVTLTAKIMDDPESAQNDLRFRFDALSGIQKNPTEFKTVEQLQIVQSLGDIGGFYATEITDQGKTHDTQFRTTKGHVVLQVNLSTLRQGNVQIGQNLIQALYQGENISPSGALVEFPPQSASQTAEIQCPPGTRLDEGGLFGLGGSSCVPTNAGSPPVAGATPPSLAPPTSPETVSIPDVAENLPSEAKEEETFASADLDPNAGALGAEEKFFDAPNASYSSAVNAYIERAHDAYSSAGIDQIAPHRLTASSCVGCVPFIIYCRDQIGNVQGLGGKTIRANSLESRQLVQDMGGSVQLLSFGDVRRALELHLIDCSISGGAIPN